MNLNNFSSQIRHMCLELNGKPQVPGNGNASD